MANKLKINVDDMNNRYLINRSQNTTPRKFEHVQSAISELDGIDQMKLMQNRSISNPANAYTTSTNSPFLIREEEEKIIKQSCLDEEILAEKNSEERSDDEQQIPELKINKCQKHHSIDLQKKDDADT